SLSRRRVCRSSGEMASVMVGHRCESELGFGAGETELHHPLIVTDTTMVSGALEGAVEHPADAIDVDDVDTEGTPTGVVYPLWPVTVDPDEQLVDVAHPGPGQGALEEACGVTADSVALAECNPAQVVDITHGVGALVLGVVGWVGRASTRLFAGVGL